VIFLYNNGTVAPYEEPRRLVRCSDGHKKGRSPRPLDSEPSREHTGTHHSPKGAIGGCCLAAMEKPTAGEERVKRVKHYSSAQSILLVGDGDFSFSLALATAFGSGANLVATSLDTYC